MHGATCKVQHAHCTLNVTDPDCTSLGCFALLGSALVLALLLLAVFQMFLQHAQRGYATARYIIVIFANLLLLLLLLCCQTLV
jgi:hypothetical protein